MKPIINYTGVQLSYNVNVPISTLIPINTGGAVSPNLRIATVSGNSNNTIYPKDGTSQEATYKFPNSVACKSDGTLAVVDDWSQTIRIISNTGISSTLAGKYEVINGIVQTGYADGQGSNARFNTPKAVAFDSDGNVIVLDTYNYRIRKVTPSGLVTTLAGSGISGLADGNAQTAQFKLLTSLWIDNQGNIFVTDNYRVRKVTPNGDVSTIAGGIVKGNINGNGTNALFKCMRGITGDNLGNLYVSDTDNNSIRRIDADGNVINFVLGIGATGITYFQGMIYVSDYLSNQIKSVTRSGVTVKVYAGSGLPEFRDGFDTRGYHSAALYAPEGIAIDNNKTIYVADKNSMKIRKINCVNYIVTPDLPNGLVLDNKTGVISGTPTQLSPIKAYTISCGNSEGISSTTIGFEIK
jgi:sugar lactone lactonase YvrE